MLEPGTLSKAHAKAVQHNAEIKDHFVDDIECITTTTTTITTTNVKIMVTPSQKVAEAPYTN